MVVFLLCVHVFDMMLFWLSLLKLVGQLESRRGGLVDVLSSLGNDLTLLYKGGDFSGMRTYLELYLHVFGPDLSPVDLVWFWGSICSCSEVWREELYYFWNNLEVGYYCLNSSEV